MSGWKNSKAEVAFVYKSSLEKGKTIVKIIPSPLEDSEEEILIVEKTPHSIKIHQNELSLYEKEKLTYALDWWINKKIYLDDIPFLKKIRTLLLVELSLPFPGDIKSDWVLT